MSPLTGLTRRLGSGRFGSMPNLPMYNIIIYCAGVEVDVLPSRVPPQHGKCVSGGFIRPTTLNIPFCPWGPNWTLANLDSWVVGNLCLRIGPIFLFEVDRAAARPGTAMQHTTIAACLRTTALSVFLAALCIFLACLCHVLI